MDNIRKSTITVNPILGLSFEIFFLILHLHLNLFLNLSDEFGAVRKTMEMTTLQMREGDTRIAASFC
jgi:hypothetical protein